MVNSEQNKNAYVSDDYIDVKAILTLIWNRRVLVLFTSLAMAIVSVVYSTSNPVTYSKTAFLAAVSDPYGFSVDAGFEQGSWTSVENSTLVNVINSNSFQKRLKLHLKFSDEIYGRFHVAIRESEQFEITLSHMEDAESTDKYMLQYLNVLNDLLKTQLKTRIDKQIEIAENVLELAASEYEKGEASRILIKRKLKLLTVEQLNLINIRNFSDTTSNAKSWIPVAILSSIVGFFFSIALILLLALLRRKNNPA